MFSFVLWKDRVEVNVILVVERVYLFVSGLTHVCN